MTPARQVAARPVLLELSRAQVEEVLSAANGASSLTLAMQGVGDVGEALTVAESHLRDRRLSRSLIHGCLVLACFAPDGTYLGNSEVAGMLGMSLSTVHRYITTLLALGLLERDSHTRRYRLAR
jgi:DNA-binding MarR family transcriptional regulator